MLGWLFSHPDERYFVRQLTALLKEDSTNISRELARLEKMVSWFLHKWDGRSITRPTRNALYLKNYADWL